jgi:hypothetical protein
MVKVENTPEIMHDLRYVLRFLILLQMILARSFVDCVRLCTAKTRLPKSKQTANHRSSNTDSALRVPGSSRHHLSQDMWYFGKPTNLRVFAIIEPILRVIHDT